MALPSAAFAQSSADQDTRLRLEQQMEGQKRETEAELLEDADALDVPTSLEIDGQTYSVGDNANDMGRAPYISIARKKWTDVQRFLEIGRESGGECVCQYV